MANPLTTPSRIRTYQQDDRPADWLKLNPHERWRCDIFPDDGSDHHGIGKTEAEAIFNAARAYCIWTQERMPSVSPALAPTPEEQRAIDHGVNFHDHRIGYD